MIELREKIKNLKENITLGSEYADGCIDTIDDVLEILNEYNVITTPKTNMINLKEKINNEKELYLKLMPGDNTEIKNAFEKGINVALKVLDDYNLITTPKSLNLSEIIDKLNKIDKSNKFKATIRVAGFVVVENTEFEKEYFYIKDDKIFDLSTYMVKPENKWLFNLWTTNTKIVDDLKEGN